MATDSMKLSVPVFLKMLTSNGVPTSKAIAITGKMLVRIKTSNPTETDDNVLCDDAADTTHVTLQLHWLS